MVQNMPRMTKAELEEILRKNSAIHIAAESPRTGAEMPAHNKKEYRPEQTTKKYFNTPVYVYEDGFVFIDKENVRKNLSTDLLEKHGKVVETFDSLREYERYNELLMLESQGLINNLQRQCKLTIQQEFTYSGSKVRGVYYKADFVYTDKSGVTVVEDVKGYDKKTGKWRTTQTFKLKWKLLKAKYPQFKFIVV